MATKKDKTKEGTFTIALLNEEQQKDFLFVTKRIKQLQDARKNHYGHNLDSIWAEADRDYIPHRLKTKGKKVIATDEERGWRGSVVNLGSNDWQSDISQANPYIKVQTALAILVDQNPSAVMTPTTKKYEATTAIQKQLYSRSWEVAKSKGQLILFVFNVAKYGWACARTYPLHLVRKVKVIKEYDEENPENTTYDVKEIDEYNDIMRENLDPRNVWIDDQARPNTPRSLNDWSFRKVYNFDKAAEEFGKYSRWQFVQPGGNIDETINTTIKNSTGKNIDETGQLVEILFYENRQKDLYMVIANGVPIIIEPLPITDTKGTKRLSLWQAYWNLRHAESPYGIGIYESIRYDQAILDRIRNMTVDQLTLSIYKMFFYQGTQSLSDTGDIQIKPGVGKQVLDPKNVNWLDVPGPGKDAYLGIDMFRRDVDEASGITDPLIGQVTGKTAFEIAQSKESALKRLKNPLENILGALNDEAYITLSLAQLIYSIPETYEILDQQLIQDYMAEIQGDPELFSREPAVDEQGQPALDAQGMPLPDKFKAHVYREFPLNLTKDEKGHLIESADTQFMRIKPSCLPWEGIIQVKSQSLLSPSKQVDKALESELVNLLAPMLTQTAQERMLAQQTNQPSDIDNLTLGKLIKSHIKLYDKDPRDILPDSWLAPPPPQPMFVPADQQPGIQQASAPPMPGGPAQQGPSSPTVVPQANIPQGPASVVGPTNAAVNPFQ